MHDKIPDEDRRKLDEALDEALDETFPASDPVAICAPIAKHPVEKQP